jgi:RNA-directed DNA polymerase
MAACRISASSSGSPPSSWAFFAAHHVMLLRLPFSAVATIIRGWAAYYRGVVSSRTFKSLDNYLWTLTYRWATRGHANKPKTWVCARYFGKFNKLRNDHWVFGDAATGAYLVKFSWTDIVRHIPVTGGASPDDPALTEYWAARRRRIKPPLDGSMALR